MSGGKKQTQESNNVQQLQLPAWLNQGAQQVWGEARRAAAENPVERYSGPLAAGSNQNLDRASMMARESSGAGRVDMDRARSMVEAGSTPTTGRVSTQDWNTERMNAYRNPAIEAVQSRTIQEMARQNKMQLNDVSDGAQGSKAFGGTRHAVLEAETRKGQNANMIDYLAQSNAQAYDDAYNRFATDRSSRQSAEATNAGLDAGDRSRQLQGAGQFASLGQLAQSMNINDIDQLVRTGLIDQQTAQSMINGNYEEFLRMQDAPMVRYMQLMGMLSGAPTDRTTTSTGKTTSRQQGDLVGNLLGAASIGASIFSDRRLKRDIVKVGELVKGVGVYVYRYAWSAGRHIGVMADEVKSVKPEAVSRVFGYDMVDYSQLEGLNVAS